MYGVAEELWRLVRTTCPDGIYDVRVAAWKLAAAIRRAVVARVKAFLATAR